MNTNVNNIEHIYCYCLKVLHIGNNYIDENISFMCMYLCSNVLYVVDSDTDLTCWNTTKKCEEACTNITGGGYFCHCNQGYTVDPHDLHKCQGTVLDDMFEPSHSEL